jgi:hypothetical protein
MNVPNLSFISLMEANLPSNKTQASNHPTNNKLIALLLENPSSHDCPTYSNKKSTANISSIIQRVFSSNCFTGFVYTLPT